MDTPANGSTGAAAEDSMDTPADGSTGAAAEDSMDTPMERARAEDAAPARSHLFERASAFLIRAVELTAESVRRIEGGWAIATPSLPQVWSLNQVRLTDPLPGSRAIELADEHLAGMPYRHLVADNEIGRALEGPLREDGFKVEREVVMAIAGEALQRGAGTSGSAVIEADEQAMLPIERRWLYEDDRISRPEVVQQLLDAGLREGRALGERRFGIAGGNGELAAMTKLRSDGHTAQVEDVYTVPEARGRGFARALVAHAVEVARLAGNDVIFIVADDNDWPKHLYARLGFRPVGLRWAFHRELSA
jgi:ribosomal protein S18 acetylase RimI-like enzyme